MGILLGVFILGDSLSVGPGDLAVEAICLVTMVVGTVLIGRSGMLGAYRTPHAHRLDYEDG